MTSFIKYFNDRSLSIIRYLLVHGSLILFISMPFFALAEDVTAVLVVSNESSINSIGILDIRRAYLGITSEDSSNIDKPVLNMAEKALYDDFIKNIMHMTEDGYRRKVIKRVFLRGEDYIFEYSSMDDLVKHLNINKNDISFMRKSEIKESYNLKIIAVLW